MKNNMAEICIKCDFCIQFERISTLRYDKENINIGWITYSICRCPSCGEYA